MQVIGYIRTSTDVQRNSVMAQDTAIRQECDRRGWELIAVECDRGVSGATLNRPGLQAAMKRVEDSEAAGLIVTGIDRIARSAVGLGRLLRWFEEHHAVLVALEPRIDTSTANGRLLAALFGSLAEWEGEVISARTREGMAVLRAQGKPTGRPAVADRPEVQARIRAMRADGLTLQAIADVLNRAGVPTARGAAKWGPSSVQNAAGYRRKTRPVPVV